MRVSRAGNQVSSVVMDGFERGVVVRHLIHRPSHRERPISTGSGPHRPRWRQALRRSELVVLVDELCRLGQLLGVRQKDADLGDGVGAVESGPRKVAGRGLAGALVADDPLAHHH